MRYKKILFLLIIIQELLNVDEFGPTPVKIQSKSIRLAGNDLKQSTWLKLEGLWPDHSTIDYIANRSNDVKELC